MREVKKHIGFVLTVIACGLFIPGIILPMFSLTMEMNIALTDAQFGSQILDKELSILNTVKELWEQQRHLVAALIFVFSVVIPVLKAGVLVSLYFVKTLSLQKKLADFVAVIGKWSMADVFVVAIFLAVLSTNQTDNAQQQAISFFGMQIGFEISSQMLSNVGQGFYYFVGYCLVAMIGAQLMQSAVSSAVSSAVNSAVSSAITSPTTSTINNDANSSVKN